MRQCLEHDPAQRPSFKEIQSILQKIIVVERNKIRTAQVLKKIPEPPERAITPRTTPQEDLKNLTIPKFPFQ